MIDYHKKCAQNNLFCLSYITLIFLSNNYIIITITVIIVTIILFYECFVFMHGKGVSMLEAAKYATGLPRHCHLAV